MTSRRQAGRSRLHLQVLGAKRYGAGLPGSLQVMARDLEGQPRKTQVEVVLTEESTRRELSRESVEVEGTRTLPLPIAAGAKGPWSRCSNAASTV